MLRFLVDENLNGDIVRGLLLQQPEVDFLRVQDLGFSGADDSSVLAWAAEQERVVVTHDRATMPFHAGERIATGRPFTGLFVVSDRLPVGEAIADLILLLTCSEPDDWRGRIVYLPL